MVITLGQQYNVGEKPAVILYTYINRDTEPPNKNNVVITYDNNAVEPYKNRGLGPVKCRGETHRYTVQLH